MCEDTVPEDARGSDRGPQEEDQMAIDRNDPLAHKDAGEMCGGDAKQGKENWEAVMDIIEELIKQRKKQGN